MPSLLTAAKQFVAMGLSPIPVPPKTKAPAMVKWQNLRLTAGDLPKHFTKDGNIGVLNGEPSGGLIDVDLDDVTALEVADALLPPTMCIFGRKSTPRSHRMYRVIDLLETVRFRDTDGTTLVELRSTGSQTIWPPGIHPSGEKVRFDAEGDPSVVNGPRLARHIREVAVASLLARHWPAKPGSRHDVANAAAGFLCRCGWKGDRVVRVIEAAARAAGDAEAKKRGRAAKATAVAIAKGKATTGRPTLAKLIPDVADRLDQWLGAVDMDAEWDPPISFQPHGLPEFPTDALPESVRAWVQAEAEATQTPYDLAGSLALAAVAVACAKKVCVRVAGSYSEPGNIFTLTVSPSGTRKSAVFRDAVAPLQAWEQSEAEKLAPKVAEASTRRRIAEAALQLAEKQAAEAEPKNREPLIKKAIDLKRELAKLPPTAPPRLIADDISPERLVTLLLQNAGRMAVMSPEGDVFDLMSGRYSKGQANFGVYLKGHAGDTIQVDRVNRPAEFVEAPALTLALTVQPDVLRGLAQRPGFRGRGLLGRFLYSIPKNRLGTRDIAPPPMPSSTRSAYHAMLRSLLMLPFRAGLDGKPAAHVLKLDDDAAQRLQKFSMWLEPQLGDGGGLDHMTDWAGKLVGATVRLAGLLHMAEQAQTSPLPKLIAGQTMRAAIRLARYFLEHAKAAFVEIGADPEIEGARALLNWIASNAAAEFRKRDAFQGTKGRFKKVAAMEPALQILVDHGYIRPVGGTERSGAGRKPSAIYAVNPLAGGPQANSEHCENSGHADEAVSGTEHDLDFADSEEVA